MGKTIAIANQKGGVGKTTTAVNLGASLALANKTVLIVDADVQRNATSGINALAMPQIPGSRQDLPHPIYKLIQHTSMPGLKSISLDTIISHTGTTAGYSVPFLKEQFSVFAQHFDFVIFDCPPAITQPTMLALAVANQGLIPIQCEYYAMEGLSQILQTIEVVRQREGMPALSYKFLMTMFETNNQLSEEIRKEVVGHFPNQTYKTMIHRDPAFPESSSHALPVCAYAPNSVGTWNYIQLCREILSNG